MQMMACDFSNTNDAPPLGAQSDDPGGPPHLEQVLSREIHHRFANSLQIIANILSIQSRSVRSEETRLHLQDVSRRLLSLSTLERHLQISGPGDRIEMSSYLARLCDKLAVSLSGGRERIQFIGPAKSGPWLSSDAANLGLIITELVINALKHAFPDGRAGRVLVDYDYNANGADWTLSVSDDGIGWNRDRAQDIPAGLGANIVEALARQLKARVDVSSGPHGTTVSVIRTQRDIERDGPRGPRRLP
jgi:chemotaxis protein methyltransferase CheR